MEHAIKKLQFSVLHDTQKGIEATETKPKIDFERLLSIYMHPYVVKKTKELRDAPPERRKELKKQLPCFTPYGVFQPTRRAVNLRRYNDNILALDIDDLTPEKALEIKEKISTTTGCMLCALSPRGKGVKALILIHPTRLTDPNQGKPFRHYQLLKRNAKLICDYLDLEKCDLAQFSLPQVMFIAHDPKLYFNKHAYATLELEPLPPVEPKKTTPHPQHETYSALNTTNVEAKNRIEKYIKRVTQNVCNDLSLKSEGDRHRSIARVTQIAEIVKYYAPHLETQLLIHLENAVIRMYGSHREAQEQNALVSLSDLWSSTSAKANETIEKIKQDIKEKA
jgi:hypothetical protein